MRYVVGIDPGLDGGIAVLSGGKGIELYVMPVYGGKGGKRSVDAAMLGSKLRELGDDLHIFLEQVGARPGQGVASMFSFGEGFGIVKGVIGALALPHDLVTPQKWRAALGVVGNEGTKQTAAARAAQLFPGLDLRATPRSKKPHDGLVDALLIAAYGLRALLGGSYAPRSDSP